LKEGKVMYAIIETGGKQYNVQVGGVVKVEKLEAAPGDKVTFDKVLYVSGGESAKVGTPYVNNISVDATVVTQGKEKKVIVYKYKSKKGFHKKKGHRQPFTSLKIDKIEA